MESEVETVLSEIFEYLRALYGWPAVFVVERGSMGAYVEVLEYGKMGWYTYDVPIGMPITALMFEGASDATPSKPVELHFTEAFIRHLRSYEAMFDFFDTTEIHVYEAVPTGPTVAAWAEIIDGRLVPTDASQLRQLIASRLK
jgi:hypothetical protein